MSQDKMQKLLALLVLSALALPLLAQEADDRARIEALSSSDARTRAMAACELGRLREGDVRPARAALLALIGDDTPVEAKLCRDWEGWRGREEHSSPGREAAMALEDLGTSVLPELTALLDDSRPAAREQAAFALGLIESERSVEPLAGALDDPQASVREQAAWGLGMIESARGVEALAGAVDDSDAGVRAQVAWGLGMIESNSGVAPLTRLLRDPEASVRSQAAWGLGMVESAAAVEALIDALDDPETEVRKQAAWALGMIESGKAAVAIVDALERETDAGVRRQLVWALGRVVSHADLDRDLDPARLAAALRRALLDHRI